MQPTAAAAIGKPLRLMPDVSRTELMPRQIRVARVLGGFALWLGVCHVAAGQPEPGRVKPLELVRPIYHPVAVNARVSGVVVVVVRVRPDGSTAGAEVSRGLFLLSEAGQRAAEASRFECPACVDEQLFTITYVFDFNTALRATEIEASGARVHVVAQSPEISHGPVARPVRSSKCLYLWRCGRRW